MKAIEDQIKALYAPAYAEAVGIRADFRLSPAEERARLHRLALALKAQLVPILVEAPQPAVRDGLALAEVALRRVAPAPEDSRWTVWGDMQAEVSSQRSPEGRAAKTLDAATRLPPAEDDEVACDGPCEGPWIERCPACRPTR